MTDKIEQRLEEIEANVPPTITGSGKCECQACQEKLALCKALRHYRDALFMSDPVIAEACDRSAERILSGEEGK